MRHITIFFNNYLYTCGNKKSPLHHYVVGLGKHSQRKTTKVCARLYLECLKSDRLNFFNIIEGNERQQTNTFRKKTR